MCFPCTSSPRKGVLLIHLKSSIQSGKQCSIDGFCPLQAERIDNQIGEGIEIGRRAGIGTVECAIPSSLPWLWIRSPVAPGSEVCGRGTGAIYGLQLAEVNALFL